ncbi:hypothetical protein PN36_10745, partial [Candidatus Thiomargarita nelsonii]
LDLSRKLKNVFQPDKLNRLCRSGDAELLMNSSFFGQPAPDLTMALSILSNENKINIQQTPSFGAFIKNNPVKNISLPYYK